MVTQTSIAAYHRHVAEGRVGPQCILILEHMEPGKGYSRKELANVSGVDIPAVCARVNEMIKDGILSVGDVRPCSLSGRLINPVIKPAT